MGSLFIHSLFRSASTYMFSVLAKNTNYLCFHESLHEHAFNNKDNPTLLTRGVSPGLQHELRHPKVDYFNSLVKMWPCWVESADLDSPVGYYFSTPGESCGSEFFKSIIAKSQLDCIFCETRTSGRIGSLKKSIDSSRHVYLYRNPWDQWWSYHVIPYFLEFNSWLYSNSREGILLRSFKEIIAEHEIDISSSVGRYALFYFLWCVGPS